VRTALFLCAFRGGRRQLLRVLRLRAGGLCGGDLWPRLLGVDLAALLRRALRTRHLGTGWRSRGLRRRGVLAIKVLIAAWLLRARRRQVLLLYALRRGRWLYALRRGRRRRSLYGLLGPLAVHIVAALVLQGLRGLRPCWLGNSLRVGRGLDALRLSGALRFRGFGGLRLLNGPICGAWRLLRGFSRRFMGRRFRFARLLLRPFGLTWLLLFRTRLFVAFAELANVIPRMGWLDLGDSDPTGPGRDHLWACRSRPGRGQCCHQNGACHTELHVVQDPNPFSRK
jgi:hypothetical protein